MGGAKAWMMEQEERGYWHVDKHICANCVTDPFLKNYIGKNPSATECGFCGKSSKNEIAADFDDIMDLIVGGIAFDWNDPNDEGIAYESREGGYLAPLTETGDLLSDYGVSENGEVLEAMIECITTDAWVEREFYRGTDDKLLMYGWGSFCYAIKHQNRYFIRDVQAEGYDTHEINPAGFLDALTGYIDGRMDGLNLVKTLPTSTNIYRVRIGKAPLAMASELGAPPVDKATQSNRMSPSGIPMFYGALDEKTAIVETLDPSQRQSGQILSIGTFNPTRELRLLDLADLPIIPSVFNEEAREIIRPLRFFHKFAEAISEPIVRDGREHIEYAPTQVMTEHLRRIYKTPDGQRLDGIIYRSAQNNGAPTCVLFCENNQACDLKQAATPNHVLRLAATKSRKIP